MAKVKSQPKTKKTLSHHDRLDMYHTVATSLELIINGDKLCIKGKKLGDAIIMDKRFGSPSAFGEAWIGVTFENGYKVAIKKMPLGKYDMHKSYTKEQLLSGDSAWAEMAAYNFCSTLVLANICPNLPLLYKNFWCPKCTFVNKRIKGKKERPCLLVVNELADGDLTGYIDNKPHVWSDELVKNCVFQIVAGLYALEKYYNMTHNDLHDGNILVHEIEPGGFWHYKVDEKNYYIPNLGYVFLLWDFGMAHVPGKIKGRPEFLTLDATPIPSETDVGRICGILQDVFGEKKYKNYLTKETQHFLGTILRHERRGQTVKDVLHENFKNFLGKRKTTELLDSFNMDIKKEHVKESHPLEMQKLIV